jgi:hypothetical protein
MFVTDLISSASGKILLGSGTPTYRFQITGAGISTSFTTGWRYGFGGGGSNSPGPITDPIQLKVQTGVWAPIFFATSDQRIKTNISSVEYRQALDVVRQLKPVTYDYIDQVHRHHQTEYGFIAQEVQPLLPAAITTQSDFIPNVYQIAHWSTITPSTTRLLFGSNLEDVQSGDTIRLIDDYHMPHQYKVLETTDRMITIDGNVGTTRSTDNTIFVYGKQVNDLHVLEKHAIFSVGMAAMKELDRIIVEQDAIIKQQQQQIEELETSLNALLSHNK